MRILNKTALFALAGVFLLAQNLQADDVFYVNENPATKFGRGLVNVIASPGEYIVQTAKLMETHDPFTAYFGGILQGTWRMVERIGGGVYELVTFPIPLPRKYEPLMDPPTTVDALNDSRVFQPN